MKSNNTRSNSRLAQSLATASGALASTLASSHGAVVQISMSGNQLSNTAGNQLFADFTNDGDEDVEFSDIGTGLESAGFKIEGVIVFASYSSYSAPPFRARAGFALDGVGINSASASVPNNIKYLNPITFWDDRINGGAGTQGYLEVNAFNSGPNSHTVALTRLVFDDASTTLDPSGLSTATTYEEWDAVPEPSSLALLALGAGGLLARRRRNAQVA